MKTKYLLRVCRNGLSSGRLPLVILAVLGQLTLAQTVARGGSPHVEQRRGDAHNDEAEKTPTTKLTDGWYTEETSPTGPFRWMSAVGHIDVASKKGGTLVIRCHLRSFVPDNSVELLVDDKPIQSIKLNGTEWQDCLLRVPVSGGTRHLSLRSQQPGGQPPGDNRVITVCLENLQMQLEP